MGSIIASTSLIAFNGNNINVKQKLAYMNKTEN